VYLVCIPSLCHMHICYNSYVIQRTISDILIYVQCLSLFRLIVDHKLFICMFSPFLKRPTCFCCKVSWFPTVPSDGDNILFIVVFRWSIITDNQLVGVLNQAFTSPQIYFRLNEQFYFHFHFDFLEILWCN
jgi:hypothetical protein